MFNCCESICQVVDDALNPPLMSANEAQMNSSEFVDKKFEKAIDVLSEYERRCYSKKTVADRAQAGVRSYQNQVSDLYFVASQY